MNFDMNDAETLGTYSYLERSISFSTTTAVNLINNKLFKFAIVGASGILINVIVTEIAIVLGAPIAVAAAAGTILSVLSNFLLLEHWVFHDRNSGKLWRRLAGFAAIGVVDYAVRIPLLLLLATTMSTAVANLLTILSVFVLRYALSAGIVWKKTPDRLLQPG